MLKLIFPATGLAAVLAFVFIPGLSDSVVVLGGERANAGVTIQSTPQELEKTSKNYRYFVDEQEPSEESERHYRAAINKWLDSLPEEQGERARKILREVHPEFHALRKAIREKKSELIALSFDRNTPPETLPRLGQQLLDLREKLAGRLKEVEKRLHDEAGIALGPLAGEGFWLSTPAGAPGRKAN